MKNEILAIDITQQSEKNMFFPTPKIGRPPVKSRRMAMVMLTHPNISQVGAAKIAGINQPKMNAYKIVRSDGFKAAYIGYQSKLNQELPFELCAAHEMYMSAYNRSATSAEMIKAVDSLCRLHGVGQPQMVEREVKKPKDLTKLSDSALIEIVENL
jgi:hypothetical protein